MSGSRKFNSYHSSARLFCSGVPVSSSRLADWYFLSSRISRQCMFLSRWPCLPGQEGDDHGHNKRTPHRQSQIARVSFAGIWRLGWSSATEIKPRRVWSSEQSYLVGCDDNRHAAELLVQLRQPWTASRTLSLVTMVQHVRYLGGVRCQLVHLLNIRFYLLIDWMSYYCNSYPVGQGRERRDHKEGPFDLLLYQKGNEGQRRERLSQPLKGMHDEE